MNILQILPELNVGGGETGTLDLSRELVRRGHRSVVVSAGGRLVGQLESDGAVHYRLPVHEKSIITMARMIPLLEAIIRKEKIDIVHARSRVPAWIAYFACRRTRTVFLTTCHGYYSRHPLSSVMGWGKRVIAISRSIAEHMTRDFHVRAGVIRLVSRSVDHARFTFTGPDEKRRGGQFTVGIIGRITPLKGHVYFFRGMARARRVIPGLKVVVVGDAPPSRKNHKRRLQALVRDLGLQNCTEFLGTRRDIPQILSKLDLLVLATTTPEAFGRVIVEAQASGVPVVATKVGGVVEIIEDGVTGLLVEPAEPQEIAEAAIKIYNDREFARALAENAYRKTRERYSLEQMVNKTLEVYAEALRRRILILKFTTVGDMVLSTAALRAIRNKFGGAAITLLASRETEDILTRCPYVDATLAYDRDKDGGSAGLWRLARRLGKLRFDAVIDLQNNRKSHILAYLSGIPERYGYDNGKLAFLLNHTIKDLPARIDPVAHQFRMLSMLGIAPDGDRLELWPPESDRRYVEAFLNSQGVRAGERLVGINISASLRWTAKNWPLQHIARLCESLSARGIRTILTGMEKDREAAGAVSRMAAGARIIDASARTTVNQLACLIEKCDAYVSCDSAPLHIAASRVTPFVALFGPTDARRHLPPGGPRVVIQKKLGCVPCYSSRCRIRECMQSITPDEVMAALETLVPGLAAPQTGVCRSAP